MIGLPELLILGVMFLLPALAVGVVLCFLLRKKT